MSLSSFGCDVNFSRISSQFVPKIVVVIVAVAVYLSTKAFGGWEF